MDKTILVLDDEQECIDTLKKFLGEFGYNVVVALYPNHALDTLASRKPNFVLFDYKMPEMDGDEFLKKAKIISPKTKFVLMTAYRDDVTIERFKKLGVYEVMIKPIDLEKLLDMLEQH